VRILHRRRQKTTCLAFSPTGDRLAVGGFVGGRKSGRVDVWDVPSGDKPITLPSLPGPPWGAAFTPDGGLAVALPDAVGLHSGARLRNVQLVHQWDRRKEHTLASLSPDGRRLLVDTKAVLRLIDLRPPFAVVWSRPAAGGRQTPGGAAFSPDGRRLAVKAEGTVQIRDALTGDPVALFEKPPTGRWSGFRLVWSPDGRWVCERWQQWLTVWDAATGRPVFQRVAGHDERINDAAFHPLSGRLGLAIGSRWKESAVRLFSPDGWREEAAYAWPVGHTEALAFHPDGTLAAVGGDKPEVIVWDVDV
jgi:WD40 repeat protein